MRLPGTGWQETLRCLTAPTRKSRRSTTSAGGPIGSNYEGRWIRTPKFPDEYSRFWFRGGGDPRLYSFWVADSIWARYCVADDREQVVDLLPDLIANYKEWEKENLVCNGLYWQNNDHDGGEMSVGGSGYRATINSYQFGDARAIANIAELAGKPDVAREYCDKAAMIKKMVQDVLWDKEAEFFKVLPRGEHKHLADVREEYGYTPWYFNMADPQYAVAWKQLMDPQGFLAPFGPTTAERRHPQYCIAYSGHE